MSTRRRVMRSLRLNAKAQQQSTSERSLRQRHEPRPPDTLSQQQLKRVTLQSPAAASTSRPPLASSTAMAATENAPPPLATLFVTFPDQENPEKTITTTHVFRDTNYRLYPQTRRTVYKRARAAEEERYLQPQRGRTTLRANGRRDKVSSTGPPTGRSEHYQKYLVQEVCMAYSSGRGSGGGFSPRSPPQSPDWATQQTRIGQQDIPLTQPLAVHIGHEPARYRRRHSSGSLREFISDYDARVRHFESTARVTPGGRHETEFPVHVLREEEAGSHRQSSIGLYTPRSTSGGVFTVPIHLSDSPYSPVGGRGLPRHYQRQEARATGAQPPFHRHSGSLGSLITETTTEEYRSFSTSRRSADDMAASSPVAGGRAPSVHELTRRFEDAAAARDYGTARRGARLGGRASPPEQRAVPVSRTGTGFSQRTANEASTTRMIPSPDERVRRVERVAVSPDERTMLTTTVVDIEPPPRPSAAVRSRVTSPSYLEERFHQEEFRTIKTYVDPPTGGTPPAIIHSQPVSRPASRPTTEHERTHEAYREDLRLSTRASKSTPAEARAASAASARHADYDIGLDEGPYRTVTMLDGTAARRRQPSASPVRRTTTVRTEEEEHIVEERRRRLLRPASPPPPPPPVSPPPDAAPSGARHTLTRLEDWRRTHEQEKERTRAAEKVAEWRTEETASPIVVSPGSRPSPRAASLSPTGTTNRRVVEERHEREESVHRRGGSGEADGARSPQRTTVTTTTIVERSREVARRAPSAPASPRREVEIPVGRQATEDEQRRVQRERHEIEERLRVEEELRIKQRREIELLAAQARARREEQARLAEERERLEQERADREREEREHAQRVQAERDRIEREERERREREEEERARAGREQRETLERQTAEQRAREERERQERMERQVAEERLREEEKERKEREEREQVERRREQDRLEQERIETALREEREKRELERRAERERLKRAEAAERARRIEEERRAREERERRERLLAEEREEREREERERLTEKQKKDSEERERRRAREREEREALEKRLENERLEAEKRAALVQRELQERQEELRRREEERRDADRLRIEAEKQTHAERVKKAEEERRQREEAKKELDEHHRRAREEQERKAREERERILREEAERRQEEEEARQREKLERERREHEIRGWIEEETTTTWRQKPKSPGEPEQEKRPVEPSVPSEMATKQKPVKPEVKTITKTPDLGDYVTIGSGAAVSPHTIGGGATTTTTTEFTLSSTGGRMAEITPEPYHSTIRSRPGFNRTGGLSTYSTSSTTSYGSPLSGNRVLKIVNEVGSSTLSGLSPFGQNAASSIRDAREREKKEMSDLNDRLASYIEKVRFLEAQNRKLGGDLALLRGRWGKDTSSMRTMYESELSEARRLIDDTTKQRDELEQQIRRLMDDLAEYRRKYEEALRNREADRTRIDEILELLSKLEAEINMLKRKIAHLEEDVTRIKKDNHRLIGELQRARNDLDQETLNRIDHQNQVQTLLEEIDFIRRVHEQEIRDLQALASRDTTPENREFFKNELASAIRDIRQEYDQITNVNRTDIESWYKLKVQEIQTQSTRQHLDQAYQKEEVKRLRTQLSELRGKLADLEGRNALLEKQTQELNYQLEDDQRSYEAALNDRDAQIRKMREECQALMVELQMLLDTKQTLDAEIAIYRKMLEGEENRAGLRQLVEQVVKTHGISQGEEIESMRVIKGETASRTSFQRSAKGNVSIHETSPDGAFIVLENTHRSKEEPIGDWKLKRKIDGKREVVFTFPRDFVLRPGKNVKIFAHGHGIASPPDVLVHDLDDSFGTGSNVHTILYNASGEERATHIQRSSHT